ncbi:DUF5337 family protein [Pontivivens nitratireducens]|jgi:hypothetical protein|uniref:DUF5337 domain-containing protein n=1 Tax=Pontivivens nitratireducens TaxID=2758038 RepID=A0A6G7VL81_9RHOB|nr:DUF5337 family protein [Pontibrevibacter nitratireducens]QIK40764.1 DUF5337 domain-containing protein [Pontibrevibacter nitratireducens]
MNEERNASLKRQTRQASIVIVAGFLGWMAFQLVGGAIGLPVRFAFLADLAMLAALAWALFVLINVWRARRSEGD